MKKFFKVVQEDGRTSVVQVDYCNSGRHDGRFAGITVIKGPALTFGQWLFLFKKEIIEKNSEEIQRVLDDYNDFYRNARIEAREMFRNEEDPEWNKTAIRTAFEQVVTEIDTEYRFIEKRYIDPMFDAGSINVESFKVTNNWIVTKAPKHIFVLLALWKKYNWSRFIEETAYAEFTPKEYYWEEIPALSTSDI